MPFGRQALEDGLIAIRILFAARIAGRHLSWAVVGRDKSYSGIASHLLIKIYAAARNSDAADEQERHEFHAAAPARLLLLLVLVLVAEEIFVKLVVLLRNERIAGSGRGITGLISVVFLHNSCASSRGAKWSCS